jgi:hypothetical protein
LRLSGTSRSGERPRLGDLETTGGDSSERPGAASISMAEEGVERDPESARVVERALRADEPEEGNARYEKRSLRSEKCSLPRWVSRLLPDSSSYEQLQQTIAESGSLRVQVPSCSSVAKKSKSSSHDPRTDLTPLTGVIDLQRLAVVSLQMHLEAVLGLFLSAKALVAVLTLE